jgi:FkbM family methyltransferase
MFRHLARKVFVGSPLEPFARWADCILTGNKSYFYDNQTFEVMRRVLGAHSCFVDVGCHKGVMLREAIKFAPDGTHWGFEPLPRLFADLQAAFPKVNLFNVALSDRTGTAQFAHVISAPELSGLQHRADGRAFQQITVRTETLDSVLGSEHVDMIKVDVEGAELLVFCGGIRTITRNRPVIVFKHGLANLVALEGGADFYGQKPEHVFDLLADCDLRLSTMKRWLQHRHSFSRDQFSGRFYALADYMYIAYPKSAARRVFKFGLGKRSSVPRAFVRWDLHLRDK